MPRRSSPDTQPSQPLWLTETSWELRRPSPLCSSAMATHRPTSSHSFQKAPPQPALGPGLQVIHNRPGGLGWETEASPSRKEDQTLQTRATKDQFLAIRGLLPRPSEGPAVLCT